MNQPEENQYLGEVLQQQQRVELDLKRKRALPPPAARSMPAPMAASIETETARGGVDYRITGAWVWRTVVVPPNAYVVHTRRGFEEPLHIGMGVSFRFRPRTDAFLVVPAAMQTIVINARCICAERQGVLVQAYVQWIIDDIATAYRRLDFSDTDDPMRIVNVQLREQAEAAIKDKVATMGIDEVLADKQPIIEELTHRLRTVAEGSRDGGGTGGLGLKIVTVQIKEAVVSSTRLWQNLQTPFRAERERLARLAALDTEQQVATREQEIQRLREMAEIETARQLEKERAAQERDAYDLRQAEAARRAQVEQQEHRRSLADQAATEKARHEAELDLALKELEVARARVAAEVETAAEQIKSDAATFERQRLAAEHKTTVDEITARAQAASEERRLGLLRMRHAIENDLSDGYLRGQMIGQLSAIAGKLPVPKDYRAINISGNGASPGAAALAGLLASVMDLLDRRSRGGEGAKASGTEAPDPSTGA